MKTNITIASNIFNRTNTNIRYDTAFVEQVRGKVALQRLKNQYGSLADGIKLSDWQEKMCSKGNSCSYAKNEEATHGVIRKEGRLVWVGRCEYSACPRFRQCSETSNFVRTSVTNRVENDDADGKMPLKYEWLGNVDSLFQDDISEEPISEEAIAPKLIIEDIKSFATKDVYKKIDSPLCIIEDDIGSRILVNAAPGSGKTYTVMRRLEYIIRNCLVEDLSKLLVLVYTNAAKDEILARLEAGVSDGTLSYAARNIDVCTFDSLATSYLVAIEEQFTVLDYNARIRLFNEKFLKENFSNFEYVIVDELQDLVNERAEMVLNILGALEGGYLLLGDKCQAIYDYESHDGASINSVEFYKKLGRIMPVDVKKYELIGNQRQSRSLAIISNRIRHALLSHNAARANSIIAEEIRRIELKGAVEQIDFSTIKGKTAILCRNNGEAEYVSHLLNKEKVPHILLRSGGNIISLHRFMADCFWDYHGVVMTRKEFSNRYCERVADDRDVASEIFDVLSEAAYEDVKEAVEIEKLVQVMSDESVRLPAVLTNGKSDKLTVSTIHKAKGREFDTVYLIDNGFRPSEDNTEESRVWYVGCTRAKSNLYKLSRENVELSRSMTCNARWMQLKGKRVKWTKQLMKHCSNVVLGLPMDIDESGFVIGDFSSALQRQEYIAEKIKKGDDVEIVFSDRRYQIRHMGVIVGYLAYNMHEQLYGVVRERYPGSKPPMRLEPVYVADIVTIIPRHFPDGVDAYYRESRFWLGLKLTGFPKIDWFYE